MKFTKRSFLIATATAMNLSALVLGAPDHWILTVVQTLAVGRIDPIISPNAVSSHVHNVFGASNFNWHMNDYATMQKAKCTTAIIGDDKSNYWSPLLYYQYPNGTFSPILGGSRIYYFTKTPDVKPFPEGLRMISGTAMARNASAYQSLGVMISCDHGAQTKFLPNGTSHPGGCSVISAAIYFPSCGTGALDSSDHFSHMAWPQSYNGPNLLDDPNGTYCPASHPIKYPTIFAEFNYYLDKNQPWRNDECTLVLANGDCLGSSMHADFANGWKTETLTAAISQCGLGKGPGDQLQNCAPLAKTMNETATWYCGLEGQIPDESVGYYRPIKALPGCNPLWKASVAKKPTCSSTPTPKYVGPNVYFNNLQYRTRIPLAIPGITNTSQISHLWPSLGDFGASKIVAWGTDSTDAEYETVGSAAQIAANLASGVSSALPKVVALAQVGGDATDAADADTASATETADATYVSASETADAYVDAYEVTATETAAETAAATKSCNRKKRGLLPSTDALADHLSRRSRRQQFEH